MYGWTVATTMAKALEQMKEPTRAALMDAVRNMDLEQGTLLPGDQGQDLGRRRLPARGHADHASSTARTGSSRAT